MSGRLDGRVAIVVGAGSTPGDTMGNGRATAIVFAREGAKVMAVDYRLESAEETVKMIKAEKGTAFAFKADVTGSEDCKRMADACIEKYGKIDILHNNVGIGEEGGPVELSEEKWDKVLDTNLKSMYLTCKYVLPYMEKQGSGSVINISSLGAIRFPPYPMLAYSTSKGAINSLTRSIAMQYAHQNIRCNAIMPGLIDTPMAIEGISKRLGMEKAELKRLRDAAVPMNHMGEAWDIAYAALFLASDEAKYVTGVLLPVDGGISCKG
jgi:NAD(P)-dependent dehydrogenase (short-subunit alcohol dehydrogenase family)